MSLQLPEEQWSEPEKWVWQEVCAGQTADFNAREGQAEPLDTTTSQGWGDARKLRADFLKQILLRQPYCAAIPTEGVRIVGAWVPDALKMDYARLSYQLWFKHCRFEKPATMIGLRIDGWLSLEGSTFADQASGGLSLDLNGATIIGNGGLARTHFTSIELTGAEFRGELLLQEATIDCKLDMNGIDVAHDLQMANATLQDVDLTGGQIGGELDLEASRSTVS